MPTLYKLILTVLVVVGFISYDFVYAIPVDNVRVYNLVVELFLSLMSAILFMSIESLKGKFFYKYLCLGFFFLFVSMLVDGLDQLHFHGEIYTVVFEKLTLLIGFVFLFIGMESWISEHARLNKKLEKQTFTDALTGLYNRRGMLKKFEAMDVKAEQSNLPLSFIIADLDDFKIYNDTMGHVSGDAYLADLGATLLGMADEKIVIGRWGGEEFAVCLLGSDINQALALSEKIRKKVVQIPMPIAMSNKRMTVSLGVSQKIPHENLMDAIKRADRSLYVAKRQGKNQTNAE